MNQKMNSALSAGDNTPVVLNGASGQAEFVITSVELVDVINQFRREEGNETEKKHDDLLKSIRKEVETLKNAGIEDVGNFSEMLRQDSYGRNQICYSMNKAGALHMLNKESAVVRFKTTQYIEQLEKQLKNKPISLEDALIKGLEAQKQLRNQINQVNNRTLQVNAEVQQLKSDMPLFNIECKELQALVKKKGTEVLGGYHSKAYDDQSIRTKVYSDIQKQLRREFGVSRYEAIKHSQLEIAKQIIANYKAPLCLTTEIGIKNCQVTLTQSVKPVQPIKLQGGQA